MTIQKVLIEKNISVYRLAQISEMPYTTINDICSGKTSLEKCSAETVYRISKAVDMPMEVFLAPLLEKRPSFENFKSTVCHRVKEKGDIGFITETIERQEIRAYYNREWYPESLYLLAMLDYLSREHNVPLCVEYDDLRKCKLEKMVYPASVMALYTVLGKEEILQEAADNAIPEFKRFNIIEGEIRSVC